MSKKLDELEKRIEELEYDSKCFCEGMSIKQVKVKDVVYKLLEQLGYKLEGMTLTLTKK